MKVKVLYNKILHLGFKDILHIYLQRHSRDDSTMQLNLSNKYMNIFKVIMKGSYSIFAICVGAGSYIYITKDIGGDSFIGVCSFGISSILCFILYQVAIWLNQELSFISSKCDYPQSECFTFKEEYEQTKLIDYTGATNGDDSTMTTTKENDISVIEFNEQQIETREYEEALADDTYLKEKEESNEELLEELKIYTSLIFEPYVRATDIPILLQILEDFAGGKMNGTTFNRPLSTLNGLTVKDFMHYGWNIWARLKPMNRRNTARFLKNAFPTIMKDTKESSIYAKMTCDEGAFSIKIVKLDDSLI
jgi:hypothetical protein